MLLEVEKKTSEDDLACALKVTDILRNQSEDSIDSAFWVLKIVMAGMLNNVPSLGVSEDDIKAYLKALPTDIKRIMKSMKG